MHSSIYKGVVLRRFLGFMILSLVALLFSACGGGSGPLAVKSATATFGTTLTNAGTIAGVINLKDKIAEAGYVSNSNFKSFNFKVDVPNCKIVEPATSFSDASKSITFNIGVEGSGCRDMNNIVFNGNYESNLTISGTNINTTNSIEYNIPVSIDNSPNNSTIKDINISYKKSSYNSPLFVDTYFVSAPVGTALHVELNSSDANSSPIGNQTIGSNGLDVNLTYPISSVGKYIMIDVKSTNANISKKVLLSGIGIDATSYTCVGGSEGKKCKAVLHLSVKGANSSLADATIDDFIYIGKCGIYPNTKDLDTGNDGNVSVNVAVNSGESCRVEWNGKIKQ